MKRAKLSPVIVLGLFAGACQEAEVPRTFEAQAAGCIVSGTGQSGYCKEDGMEVFCTSQDNAPLKDSNCIVCVFYQDGEYVETIESSNCAIGILAD